MCVQQREQEGVEQQAILKRELFRFETALPTLSWRAEFEDKVRSRQVVVVKGAAGCGKSTQLPQYLADMLDPQCGQVILHLYISLSPAVGVCFCKVRQIKFCKLYLP